MRLDKDLYTIDEVAELFEVTKPTIYDWMSRRGLAWIKVGGRRRITKQAIEAFIIAGEQGGDSGYNPSDIRTPMIAASVTG